MGIGRTGDRRARDPRVDRARDARVGRSPLVDGMPLNASLAGKTYPVVPFPVVARHVAAFSAAVAHPTDGVPPTFATAPELLAGLRNVLADPELRLDLTRVLHGEQAYEWARPIETGEVLSAHATIEQIRAKGGVELLTLRTDLRDAAGQIVVVARSTLVIRSPVP